MQRKPESKIQDDADHGRRDGGERRSEFFLIILRLVQMGLFLSREQITAVPRVDLIVEVELRAVVRAGCACQIVAGEGCWLSWRGPVLGFRIGPTDRAVYRFPLIKPEMMVSPHHSS